MKRSMVFHRGLLETKMEEIPEVTKKLAPFAKKQSRNIIMEKKIRKRYHSEEAVKKAVAQIGGFHEVKKVEDIVDIMNYGVMSTPALVVDGIVKSSGKLLSIDEIINLLKGK